jgi:hypothetical protein
MTKFSPAKLASHLSRTCYYVGRILLRFAPMRSFAQPVGCQCGSISTFFAV